MENYLPKGFRDYVDERADALEAAGLGTAGVFTRWGYRRLVPSMVENADTFAQGASGALLRDSFRFADRTGELLVLRPDMTLQAARLMAGELRAAQPPIRLSYVDRVFRNAADGQGALREVWQAGVELAGVPGAEADAEVIAVALEALAELGAGELQVDLGHAGFVREFLAAHKLTGTAAAQTAEALQRKDMRTLTELHEKKVLSAGAVEAARMLAGSFGLTSVADLRALRTAVGAEPVDRLSEVAAVLEGYGVRAKITFDPGEVRGLDYYTGVFFHVYQAGLRKPLAAGGRYDGLLAQYGRDLPAVGCAVDLASVAALRAAVRPLRIHVVNLREDRGAALGLAQALRRLGFAVSRDIVKRPPAESQAYARAAAMDYAIFVEPGEVFRVITLRDLGTSQYAAADDILRHFERVRPRP